MDPSYGGEFFVLAEREKGAKSKRQARADEKNTIKHEKKLNLLLFFFNKTEKTWKVLEDAIHEINNHNASGLSFEELYR